MCLGIGVAPYEISSKANAVQYAISLATTSDKNGKPGIDLVLAAGIYEFIEKRVVMPDISKAPTEDLMPLIKALAKKIESLDKP